MFQLFIHLYFITLSYLSIYIYTNGMEDNMNQQSKHEKLFYAFLSQLQNSNLSDKVIERHVFSLRFYMTEYLDAHHGIDIEESVDYLEEYFTDFFLSKAMWSTAKGIKDTITTFNKFYKFLYDEKQISKDIYSKYKALVKENKEIWIQQEDKPNKIDLSEILSRNPWDSNPSKDYCVIHKDIPYFFTLETEDQIKRLNIYVGLSDYMNKNMLDATALIFDELNYMSGYSIEYNLDENTINSYFLEVGRAPRSLLFDEIKTINTLIPSMIQVLNCKKKSNKEIICIENNDIRFETMDHMDDIYMDTLTLAYKKDSNLEKKVLSTKKKSQAITLMILVLPPKYIQDYYEMVLKVIDDQGDLIDQVYFGKYNQDQVIYDFILRYISENGMPNKIYTEELPIHYNMITILNEMELEWDFPNQDLWVGYKTGFYLELYHDRHKEAFIEQLPLVKKYEPSLSKALNLLSVDDLKKFYHRFGGQGKLKKAGLIAYIEDFILDIFDAFMAQIHSKDYDLLMQLKDLNYLFPDTDKLMLYEKLIRIGFIHVSKVNHTYMIWVPKEIKDLIVNSETDFAFIQEQKNLLKDFTLACINLYGALSKTTYFSILQSVLKPTEEQLNFFESYFEDQFSEIYADLVEDVIIHEIFEGQITEKVTYLLNQDKPYFMADANTFLKFSDEMYLEDTEERDDLLKEIQRKTHLTYDQADDLVFDIKELLEDNNMQAIFDMLHDHGYKFSNEKDLNHIMKLIYAYNNNCRIWENHGFTPNEIHNTSTRTSKKVGRNEPCPCGSGKKYKKCCGSNVH